MLLTRIIPALLLRNDALVKSVKFQRPNYIGDPINTVRIFNELEVDELVFLDITATNEKRKPNLKLLAEIANECFMPLGYGGGLNDFEVVKDIFSIGFEKVVLNSVCHEQPSFVTRVSEHYGNQAVVASVDVKKNIWGNYDVYSHSGKRKSKKGLLEWIVELEQLGAGELLLTSIDKEGTWSGFDLNLIQKVTESISIPVIAHGGAGNIQHIGEAVNQAHASAVALGSMVMYQQKGMGVLVNFPEAADLNRILNEK
jgi:imidazole glycerol-phosphate synthase subunit HisF